MANRRRSVVFLCAAILVLSVSVPLFAQAPPFETRKITDRVYIFRYGGH